MSFSKGDCQRQRAQKYKNTFAFKNNLHDNSERTKQLNAMSINEICTKCKDQIEWKIKFRKYKALTKPAACNKCLERKVKKAYYMLCRECASAQGVCAKCCKSDLEIIPPEPDDKEKLRLEIEMKFLIKSLPERKRRTFLRFMKGKKKQKNVEAVEGEEGEEPEEEVKPKRKTREELLEKIDELKGIEGDRELVDGEESSDDEDFSSGDEFY